MLGAMALLTLSLYFFLLPYLSIAAWIKGQAVNDYVHTVAGLFAPFMTFALLFIGDAISLSNGRALIAESSDADLSVLAGWPELLGALISNNVLVKVAGDPDKVLDSGGPVAASPRLASSSRAEGGPVILMPALAWKRLYAEPAALAAVIGHEFGHVEHRDLRLVLLLERVLRVSVWVTGLVVLESFAYSSWIDVSASSTIFEALLVNLVGKSADIVMLVLAFAGIGLVRASQNLREALADETAIEFVGLDALRKAETILGGAVHGANLRPWQNLTRERAPWWRPLLTGIGFAVASFAAYAASPVAILCDVWPSTFTCKVSDAVFPMLQFVSAYAVCCAVLGLYLRSCDMARLWKRATEDLIWVCLGWVLGFLLTQSLPIALTALPMFDRYPNLSRHDALPNLMADALEQLVAFSTAAALAITTRTLALHYGRWWLWTLTGALALCLGDFEVLISGAPTLGLLGPLVLCVFAIGVPFFLRADFSRTTWIRVSACYLLLLGGFVGVAGPTSISIGFGRAGLSLLDRNQNEEGLLYLRTSAWFAPFSSVPWSQYSHAIDRVEPGNPDAIMAADRALRAPFLSDWNERAEAATWAGYLHLKARRNADDWGGAASELELAADLWRRSMRISNTVGTLALYNLAVIDVLRKRDISGALLKLNEAAAENPEILKFVEIDPDLRDLRIQEIPPPAREDFQLIQSAHPTWRTFQSDTATIGITARAREQFLAFSLRCQMKHAGLNAECKFR